MNVKNGKDVEDCWTVWKRSAAARILKLPSLKIHEDTEVSPQFNVILVVSVDIITWKEKCPYGHAFANTWIGTYYVTKKNPVTVITITSNFND